MHNVKAVYDKYKNNNFTVLGVSSDVSKNDWMAAIKHDNADWTHLIIGENMSVINREYSIIGIPEILLVNPEGKILAKGLRGEDIEIAVSEAINK